LKKTMGVPCAPLRTQAPTLNACWNVSQRLRSKPRAIECMLSSTVLMPRYGRCVVALAGDGSKSAPVHGRIHGGVPASSEAMI
jgi:hypothetical protein